ncbi:MAG: glucosyl-3-phosphoglycerate synthase [bacterium]
MSTDWLSRNSLHHTQFSDIDDLLGRKREQGLTISVAFPAFNEEATIGSAIRVIREELVERYPLVDEIAVIDGGSFDGTISEARSAGAEVFSSADCLARLGHFPGKGDNLWKSLFLLSGDILVWLDADIKNMHPKFVYGLVGPLLHHPEIQFAKAYYERPLHRPEETDDYGGGRVTEILVRPLFSAFFPELAQFYQPCSGECAGRREILESLPFCAGYGIETGMLIDIHHKYGYDVIAQVNLDKRIHRNQPTTALGKMGFEILHTFMSRLKKMDKASFEDSLFEAYKQLVCSPSVYSLEDVPVQLRERPPMSTVPEYRQRRGIDRQAELEP